MASIEPLSPFDPLYGSHRSCGDFRIQLSKRATRAPAKIEVRYDRTVGRRRSLHRKWTRWYGNRPTALDLRRLLESADVPGYIHRVDALYLISGAVDVVLKECESLHAPLPSLLVCISSVQSSAGDCSSSPEDYEDEEY